MNKRGSNCNAKFISTQKSAGFVKSVQFENNASKLKNSRQHKGFQTK